MLVQPALPVRDTQSYMGWLTHIFIVLAEPTGPVQNTLPGDDIASNAGRISSIVFSSPPTMTYPTIKFRRGNRIGRTYCELASPRANNAPRNGTIHQL